MKMAKLAAPRMTPKRLHRIPAVIITNITAICVRVVQDSSISMVIRHGKSMACICSYPSIFMRTRIHPGPVSLISRTLDAWSIPSHWGHLRPNPRRIPIRGLFAAENPILLPHPALFHPKRRFHGIKIIWIQL